MTEPIKCKAAVCWAPKQPLKVENIIVAAPKKGEARNSHILSDYHLTFID